ncbi:MAG: hypothetical protein HY438_01425 [DPANN group archaeon]|nr:hypothetical protein [DPANN group archaeon]
MKFGLSHIFVFAIVVLGISFFASTTNTFAPTGEAVDSSQYFVRLVRCINGGNDAFESTQDTNTCEVAGQRFVGPLGFIFKVNVQGSHPIYRCMVRGREAMTTVDSNCENSGRGAIKQNKYVGRVGYLYDQQQPGTIPLYRCYRGADHFLSVSSSCEGAANEGVMGYAYSELPKACQPKCTSSCGGESDGCEGRCPAKPANTACTLHNIAGTCDGTGGCVVTQFCTDTDQGDDYAHAGLVTDAVSSGQDTCIDEQNLVEYLCNNNNKLETSFYTCDAPCKDGACASAVKQVF